MARHTILLVDADPDSVTIYSLMLEHRGFRVLRAATVEDGFRAACEHEPSVIVTELVPSAPGGRPLAELLRSDARTAHLPLVGISALPTHPGLADCDVRIAKPCVPTRMLQEVERLLVQSVPV